MPLHPGPTETQWGWGQDGLTLWGAWHRVWHGVPSTGCLTWGDGDRVPGMEHSAQGTQHGMLSMGCQYRVLVWGSCHGVLSVGCLRHGA